MNNKKILSIEDNKDIYKMIKYNLELANYECQNTITGEEALDLLKKQKFDLIVLDIMLPKMDGLEICKLIKQDKNLSSIPIIMLTAREEEIDKIIAFELGVEDYIVKPFSPRELVLRIKSILRRKTPKKNSEEILINGHLKVDISRCKVSVDNKEVKLTATEYKLLVSLMQQTERVITRSQLLRDVWNLDPNLKTRTVDTHIQKLRNKIGKTGNLIETIRGLGYRMNN